MTRPRYSIIPGDAVTDPNLEGNDLRVLCFLGQHTDKLGWCFLSQGKIAAALGIGRATVQRSLARLVDAGYVDIRSSVENGRPHACHAYRVIMDRDDAAIEPSESEVEDQRAEGGCPPAGTPDEAGGARHRWARVPAIDGHGVPTHTRAHNDQDSELRDRDTRASPPLISREAFALADEYRKALGADPDDDRFSGLAYTAQIWITRQYDPCVVLATAADIAGNHGHKPLSYHAKAVEQRCEAAKSKPVSATPERPNAAASSATGWRQSRDKWREAAARFSAAVDEYAGPEKAGSKGCA